MILFDTSIWIDHFRNSNATLVQALEENSVVINEVVIGELSASNVPKRKQLFDELNKLQLIPIPSLSELLSFIENQRLFALGLSWSDLQILASALVARTELLTLDKKLARQWNKLSE